MNTVGTRVNLFSLGNSHFAKDLQEHHTLYMMDDIECLGNETSLMQCNFAGWGIHNCADREVQHFHIKLINLYSIFV